MSAENPITAERYVLEKENDTDFILLSRITNVIEQLPSRFVIVTGSCAIDSLTGVKLVHEDMDANILSSSGSSDIPKVASIIQEHGLQGFSFSCHRATADRLEYDVTAPPYGKPKRLEFKFIKFSGSSQDDHGVHFQVPGQIGIEYSIPTVLVSSRTSSGTDILIRSKSLDYMIATWALRISGFAQNALRPVRQSDIMQLRLLLAAHYDSTSVEKAIATHVQAPKDIIPNQILNNAIKICQT